MHNLVSYPTEDWKQLWVTAIYPDATGRVCIECLEQANHLRWKTEARSILSKAALRSTYAAQSGWLNSLLVWCNCNMLRVAVLSTVDLHRACEAALLDPPALNQGIPSRNPIIFSAVGIIRHFRNDNISSDSEAKFYHTVTHCWQIFATSLQRIVRRTHAHHSYRPLIAVSNVTVHLQWSVYKSLLLFLVATLRLRYPMKS